MNKLFTKVATLSIGLTMAIGVGVAVGGSKEPVKAEAAIGSGYTLITAVSSLSNGDKVVLYDTDADKGITGYNDNKDGQSGATGWIEFDVTKTTNGFNLTVSTDLYVTLASGSYKHTATATDLSVTSNGYLCTVNNADLILYRQSSYIRGYTGKSSDTNYHPFSVYKVGGGGGDPAPNTITIDFTTTTDCQSASTTSLVYAHTKNGVKATVSAAKGSASTNTNNYYPGTSGKTYNHTRFYTNSTISIDAKTTSNSTPMYITGIVINANTANYATTMNGFTWANVTSTSVNDKVVTLVPSSNKTTVSTTIGGTCGVNSMEITWSSEEVVDPSIDVVSSLTVGTLMTETVQVSFANLTQDISITSNNENIILSKNSISKSGSSDSFTVTGGESAVNSGTITLTSGSLVKTINVTVSAVKSYSLVNDLAKLTAGTKFMISSSDGTVVASTFSSTLYGEASSQIHSTDHKLRTLNGTEFTLGGSAGAWTISDGAKYIGMSSQDGNKLTQADSFETDSFLWTITAGENDTIVITNKLYSGYVLQHNASSHRFTDYASSQAAIKMYAILAPGLIVSPNTSVSIDTGASTSLTVSALNFSGTVSYQVTSSDNDVVTGSVAGTTLTINGGSKAGTETLTVTATYGQNESASAEVEVTVNSAGRQFVGIYTGVSTESLYVNEAFRFSGTVYAVYDDESEDAISSNQLTFSGYNMSTTGTYQVTITYTGEPSDNTTTYTLKVVEYPYTVASSINGGDKIIMSYSYTDELENTTNYYLSSGNGSLTAYSTYPGQTFVLTVVAGSVDGTIALKTSEGKYLSGSKSNNNLTEVASVSANSSWTVDTSGSQLLLINYGVAHLDDPATKSIGFNYNNGSPKFGVYANSTTYPGPTIYKLNGSSGSEDAIDYADGFLTYVVDGVCAENNPESFATDMSEWWEEYSAEYDSLSDEAKAYIASKSANASGDKVEKMLYEYNHIYSTYGTSLSLENFIGRIEPVKSSRTVNPAISAIGNDATLIIIVASIVSLTAMGGYFLFKKKKQN